MTYDRRAVAEYFDALADREWDRLETSLQGRIKCAIHQRLIAEHVQPGMRVLDVGAGPGRFAVDVVERGARVTLVDLSQVQLDLAQKRLTALGALDRCSGFHRLDVLDLSSLAAASYDAVVCFGGAVSYTRERHVDALHQLARVTRPGGRILLSVMSLFGTLRLLGPLDASIFLETVEDHLDWHAVSSGASVVYTRVGSPEFHQPLALFTASGLRAALISTGFEVEGIATSNPLVAELQSLPKITESPSAARALSSLEIALSQQPGLLDAGGHLLAVARRPG
jgi:2-polyprenyl-3-methyl-5-hydroxy-6-metoxy-1,4-benzoquinol methylase